MAFANPFDPVPVVTVMYDRILAVTEGFPQVRSAFLAHVLVHEIGRYSRIRRAIIDSGARIPESSSIGFDAEADRAAGYTVTESGIVVVPSRAYNVSQAFVHT